MSAIIYIHGFLSSPQSFKARVTETWLRENRPDLAFYCPALSSYPAEALQTLKALVHELRSERLFVIGSSLGGFWATYLVEQGLAQKAVLVNPAVLPKLRLQTYVGEPLKSYYTEEIFTLSEKDIEMLADLDCLELAHPDKYWLMVQKGDETLDYRDAVKKYKRSRQRVEEGGSHTFDGYKAYLPEIMNFFAI